MFANLNHNDTNRISYYNKKRIFITLLVLNTFLGCIYYIIEKKKQEISQNTISASTWNNNANSHQSSIKTNKAIEFIQNTLANEYNQDDLIKFYDHVKKECTLGLKCTRKQNILQAMVVSNVTNEIQSTAIRTHSKSHRFQLTDLYTYIIDHSDVCLNETVDLLIIIMSKSDNYKTRDAIRRTWASGKNLGIYSSINVKYFFLIDFDEKLSHSIQLENKLFHDLIQVELPQQYTLVTYRVISLFEWSFRYCRTAKFLFKTDDDVFINLILLLKFISPLIKQPINNSFVISDMNIYGIKHIQSTVSRDGTGPVSPRYIVTFDEYPCEQYPTYLSGYGYLISKKARDAILYTAYQDSELFRISDVYLTGIIPEYLSISHQSMSDYIQSDYACETFFNISTAFACAGDSHHGIETDVFRNYNQHWQLIKKKHKLFH